MKKIWLFILWLCTLFPVWNFTQANSEYEYTNLDINANILEDWTINVKENFIANFFVNKHGIIRTIPLNYSVDWTKYHIDISDINVEWKTFTTNLNEWQREIKIWDADKTIIGEQTYPISYTTYWLIKDFSEMGYSELYWNLVGNGFDTSINKVRAVIYLPKIYTGFTNNDFLIRVGWTATKVEDFQWKINRSQWDKIIITYGKWLSAYQWITLSIKFPNDYFKFDYAKQRWLIWMANSIDDNYAHSFVDTDTISDNISDNNSGNNSIITSNITSNTVDEYDYNYNDNQNWWNKSTFHDNNEYEYTNLDIVADISNDGTMTVKENFTADFLIYKHWIIRDIPLNYNVGWNDFHIEVSNINVQWKNFTKNKSNWNIEIKIWDADKTLIWEQDYPISYSTYGLIRNYSWMWYAELYWNLVWNNFDTNINNIRANIYLPKTYTWFKDDDFLIAADWSTNSVKEFWWKVDWSKWDRITITYDKWLHAFQGITLAIKFPIDYFEFDHKRQAKLVGKAWDGLFDNTWSFSWSGLWSFLLEIIETLGFIGLFIYAFIKKGKNKISKIDTKSWALSWEFADKFPVIVQYEPPQWLNSAEVWLLLHREAQAKDMLSLIYKRAAEWLITLSTEKTEWSLLSKSKDIVIITKNRDIPGDLPGYEQDFFRSLVRSEKNKIEESTNLYSKLGLSGLESYGKHHWWFTWNKLKSSTIAIWIVCAYFLLNIIIDILPWLSNILFLVFAFWVIYLSWGKKLKETEEWAKLISHALWYREFIAMCDENKLRLFLEQDPLYFDKILPYAVAFGLETEFLKKIEPIMQEMNIKSTWYNWNLNSMYLMNDIISSVAEHSIPHYSSSGWFSGGSSFGWGFSFWGWGWGWWWRSW